MSPIGRSVGSSPGPDTGLSTITFLEGPVIQGGPVPPKKEKRKKKKRENNKEEKETVLNLLIVVE